MNWLEKKSIDLLKTELKEIDSKLTKLVAEENMKTVFKNFEHLSNTDGTTNNNGVWALQRKLFSKITEPLPIAKKRSERQINYISE